MHTPKYFWYITNKKTGKLQYFLLTNKGNLLKRSELLLNGGFSNTPLKCQKSFHNKIWIISNQYHLKWLLLGLSTIPVTTTWCPVCEPDMGLKETPEVSTLKPLSQVTWCLLESFTTTTSASATTNGFTRICLSDVLSCLLDKNTILD